MPYLIPSIHDVSEYTEISIEEVIQIISDKVYFNQVQEIRRTENKKQRDLLKKKLPALSLAKFEGGKLIRDNLVSTKYMIYDMDNLSRAELQDAKCKLSDLCLFQFVSPSGNGIKFVIEAEREITAEEYSHNRRHYLEYFQETLPGNLADKLDTAYHSLQTFVSADGSCEIYRNSKPYPVYDVPIATEAENVEDRAVKGSEVEDVLEYLSNYKLGYYEWTMCALAVRAAMDNPGVKLDKIRDAWKKMGEKDKINLDHQHRDWEKKLDSVGKPKKISVASLFWIAQDKGYKRKKEFIGEDGEKRPFDIGKDGLYTKGKHTELVFGFKDIGIVNTVIDAENKEGGYTTLNIDGIEVQVPTRYMNNPTSFSQQVMSRMPRYTYMAMSGKSPVYDKLFRWLARTGSKLVVSRARGMGCVNTHPVIWNFGTSTIIDGKVFPYEKIIQVSDTRGYILDDAKDLRVEFSKRFFKKIERLFYFYDEWAAIAIGWAAANIMFSQILSDMGGFPILFIHGTTASGKSQLAHVILAMFGVASPESSNFKINMDKASDKAMNRLKDNAAGIPHLFDEYGGTTNASKHQQHFLILKSMYDGSSTTYAKFTNDADTWKLNIRSGSIFTSCNPVTEAEGVERCAYVEMTGISQRKNASEYQEEFQGLERRMLSPFGIGCALEMNYETFKALYKEMHAKLRAEMPEGRNRPIINYALIWAGYEYFRKISEKGCTLPDIPASWWISKTTGSAELAVTSDPAVRFLRMLYLEVRMAEAMSRVVPFANTMQRDGHEIFQVNLKLSLGALEKLYPNERFPSKTPLSKALRALPNFIDTRTCYIAGANVNAYRFRVVEEDDDMVAKAGHISEPTPQDEIPF